MSRLLVKSESGKPFIKKIKNDTGISSDDLITSDNTPVIVGKAQAKSTVKIVIRDEDGNKVDVLTTKANKNGKFKIKPDALDDGVFTIKIKAKKNGKTKKSTETIEIDTTTETPVVQQVYKQASNDGMVLTFVGTAEAGAAVSILSGGTTIGASVAGADGSWVIGVITDAFNDRDFSVEAEDTAGNTADPATIIVDNEAPVISADQSFAYDENQVAGAILGTVSATDNIGITGFAFVAGNESGWFAIDDAGVITLTTAGADAAANDWETPKNAYALTVEATDADGNTTSADVDLAVGNVLENLAQWRAFIEVWEDSGSLGGGGNADGVAVTDDQLTLLVERVLAGDDAAASPMEARYQTAIADETGFSNPPTLTEIQAVIDSVNQDLSYLFEKEKTFDESYVVDWDVSLVESMLGMFSEAEAFDQDVGGWDVGNVTVMRTMFRGAEVFDQHIGDWDVSSVTDMNSMFAGALAFNQDIGNWNVGNVKDMNLLFYYAEEFNQDIGDWDVGNATDMQFMFANAKTFNQKIGDWNVSSVKDIEGMFLSASAFNRDIGHWDVSSVWNMAEAFKGASAFDQDIGGWDISSLTEASRMLDNSGMSMENFDRLLAGWSTDSSGVDGDGIDDINMNVTLGADGLIYSDQVAFDRLDITYGWTIEGATHVDDVVI